MERYIEEELSFGKLSVQIRQLGSDHLIAVWGGEKPHIGCTVLAVPRPSLTGDGSCSVTSSVLNVTGHKDEEICRTLAEQVARRKGTVTVCTGGFHADHIGKEQIDEVIQAAEKISRML